jgi:hypothetical protein
VHFRQLTIQFFNPTYQIEDDGSTREIDSKIASQSLHATKLKHNTTRQQRFISATIQRLYKSSLDQVYYQ